MHLPRIEVVVNIKDKTCPCCQGELHWIGEDKSERLDLVPAQFRILVTRRPKCLPQATAALWSSAAFLRM